MTLPAFLIVGSMKSGTTTLFQDIASHPDVFEPLDKDPALLCSDEVLSDSGRAAYERLFRKCQPHQIAFEASTDYTKIPRRTGAAERARNLLGSDLKVLYIVRAPVARARSQHRHLMDAGVAGPDFDAEVAQNPDYIDFSRYAMQIAPWIECFSESQVRVIKFESYIADRTAIAAQTQAFLGLRPRPDLIDLAAANVSEGKEVHTAASRRISRFRGYRTMVRPWLPGPLRRSFKRTLMGTSTSQALPASEHTVARIADETANDVRRISPLIHPPLPSGELAWPHGT